jgi:hypothetical protein
VSEGPSTRDDDFLADIRRVLDSGAIDADVETRLLRSRQRAVAAAVRAPRPLPTWLPAGALALTLCVLGFAWFQAESEPTLPYIDDDRALAAAQELELLEDLEFLAWLGEDVHAG